jgi:hypothetical protein
MPDDNGDESDGKDETMVPLDYQRCVPVGWATGIVLLPGTQMTG